MRNFHLPLPEQTYEQLRAESLRTEVPATTLAREAINAWLRERAKEVKRLELSDYIDAVAGSLDDLDPDLEAAGIEHLLAMEKREGSHRGLRKSAAKGKRR